jgi:hypothetical protein
VANARFWERQVPFLDTPPEVEPSLEPVSVKTIFAMSIADRGEEKEVGEIYITGTVKFGQGEARLKGNVR